jgi:3-deoxy-D-manno-octulosonic-acid transferase
MLKIYLLLYNLSVILFLPLIVLFIYLNKKHRKDFFYQIKERFAFYNYKKNNPTTKKTIWVHCASLGEVCAVEALLDKLKDDYVLNLTAMTRSGLECAKKYKQIGFAALLPLDIYPLTLKAFNTFKPDIILLFETELWANLIYSAKKKNVKAAIINGRLSEKSFNLYKKSRFFFKEFLQTIQFISARTPEDGERFRYLTGSKDKIIISGNIKYDVTFALPVQRKDFNLKENDFVFTAGSIRPDEEKIIADAYFKLSNTDSAIKFIIAPRHLSRIKPIIKIFKDKGVKYSLFSEGGSNGDVVLIDVFGKLQNAYSISDCCFVGGSISDNSGQNPIEPAMYSKPVLFGKNMTNFKYESKVLIENGGAYIVDEQSITDFILKFKNDKNFCKNVGGCAFKAVQSQKGAVQKTVNLIKEILNEK